MLFQNSVFSFIISLGESLVKIWEVRKTESSNKNTQTRTQLGSMTAVEILTE